MAEKPTSSSTMYTTFGAPSGALGAWKGDQSGSESRMSTLIVPLNPFATMSLPDKCSHYPTEGRRLARGGAPPPFGSGSTKLGANEHDLLLAPQAIPATNVRHSTSCASRSRRPVVNRGA